MQFFGNYNPTTTDDFDSISEVAELELSPGVILERRMILGFGLGAFAALIDPGLQKTFGQERPASQPLNAQKVTYGLETLISQIRPEARQMIASESPDEEKYIEMAVKELSRVTNLDTNGFQPGGKGWEMDLQAYIPPLMLYQIRMSPNAVIALHDHRYHNGALTAREGSARVRSFDIHVNDGESTWDVAAGKVPAMGEEFLIQEKGELALKQGQAAGLTRTRENIHQIEAGPDGCLLYDLFTNFKPNAQSFGIAWDGKYFDSSKKLCKVTWIAPDHNHK